MTSTALHSILATWSLARRTVISAGTPQQPEEFAATLDDLSLTVILAGAAGTFVVFALIAAVLIHLTPEYTRSTNRHLQSEPVTTGLFGFATIVSVIVASIVLILTLFGALLGIPLMLGLVLVSFVGTVIVEILIGRLVLDAVADRTVDPPTSGTLWTAFGIGFVVVLIGSSVPVVGGLVALSISSLGIGAMIQQFRNGSALTPTEDSGGGGSWGTGGGSWEEPKLRKDADLADGLEEDGWGTNDRDDDTGWGADDDRNENDW